MSTIATVSNSGLRVLVLGGTGTAGQATTRSLLRAGHQVSCLIRNGTNEFDPASRNKALAGVELIRGDISDDNLLEKKIFTSGRFDVLVSCMASRTGIPSDAWAIDHQAHSQALNAARESGVKHMVLLSAICVQRPLLAFQQAKLAFEAELINSGLGYSIVRPTAFFKSLSGQVERVRRGKPFLVFGDGRLTSCKPISDDDLGDYIADCVTNKQRHNQILPIGGPGDAMTPREQGELLFDLTKQKPRFKQVPVALLDAIRLTLEQLGRLNKACSDKAELAKIGRYYATESMLVLNAETGEYDADATPATGSDTLEEFYAALLSGSATVDRGEHAVFK